MSLHDGPVDEKINDEETLAGLFYILHSVMFVVLRRPQGKNLSLSQELHNSVDQNTRMCERLIVAETTRDSLKGKLASLKEKTGLSITMMLNKTEEEDETGEEEGKKSICLLQELQDEIEEIGVSGVTGKGC